MKSLVGYLTIFVTLGAASAFAENLPGLRIQHVFTPNQLVREVNGAPTSASSNGPSFVYGGLSDGNCVAEACRLAGEFACDSQEQLLSIAKSCSVEKTICLKEVCSRLGEFGCDDYSKVKRVLVSCGGGESRNENPQSDLQRVPDSNDLQRVPGL
jgi:hypothetical protein